MIPAYDPEALVLVGHHVRLEPLSANHSNALFDIARHPDAERMFRYLPDTAPATLQQQCEWVAALTVSRDPLFFVCTDVADHRVMGRQALMRITPAHGVIEIGNILWGPDMAQSQKSTEAFFLMARYVFEVLGYRRFEWKCDALNLPSRRAAERFGFQFEGIFEQHMWIKGKNRDTAWYAMLDRDWPRQKASFEAWFSPDNFDDAGRQRRALSACRGETP